MEINKEKISERNRNILKEFQKRKTLDEIGLLFKLTRERVRQILFREIKKDILVRLRMQIQDLTYEESLLLNVAAQEEIREIINQRKYFKAQETKKEFEEKMKNAPHYSNFNTINSYAKIFGKDSMFIKKYFPEIFEEISFKKKKLWSTHYNKCRKCGTTSIKYGSYGLCIKCYHQSEMFKDAQLNSRIRRMAIRGEEIKQHEKEYLKEYLKRPEVLTKMKKRNDLKFFGGNREKALIRDNYKCQKCGIFQEESYKEFKKDLFVVHIKNAKNNNLNNLVTLCKKCYPAYISQKKMRGNEE